MTCTEFLLRTVVALREYDSLPRQAAIKLKALFEGFEASGPVKIKIGVFTRTATDLLSETIRSVARIS